MRYVFSIALALSSAPTPWFKIVSDKLLFKYTTNQNHVYVPSSKNIVVPWSKIFFNNGKLSNIHLCIFLMMNKIEIYLELKYIAIYI